MTHPESLCHAKTVVLVASTQIKGVVRVPRDSVFESVIKDGEGIEDAAHETLAIASSVYALWFVVGESVVLTLELV
jgi:hypothetical protein